MELINEDERCPECKIFTLALRPFTHEYDENGVTVKTEMVYQCGNCGARFI